GAFPSASSTQVGAAPPDPLVEVLRRLPPPSASSPSPRGDPLVHLLGRRLREAHSRRTPATAAPVAPWNGSPHGGGDDGGEWGKGGGLGHKDREQPRATEGMT